MWGAAPYPAVNAPRMAVSERAKVIPATAVAAMENVYRERALPAGSPTGAMLTVRPVGRTAGPTDGVYNWRLARQNLSALPGRWKGGAGTGSPELRLAGYREIEHEVEPGAVPG